MYRKIFFITLIICAQILIGCGSEEKIPPPKIKFSLEGVKDGTYKAESSRDDKLGYSKLSLTIKGGKITGADFQGVDLFGNVKDENYGSLTGKDSADYKKAQVAVNAIKKYPAQLLETQNLDEVDAISGASISYGQFVETVTKAVDDAKR